MRPILTLSLSYYHIFSVLNMNVHRALITHKFLTLISCSSLMALKERDFFVFSQAKLKKKTTQTSTADLILVALVILVFAKITTQLTQRL